MNQDDFISDLTDEVLIDYALGLTDNDKVIGWQDEWVCDNASDISEVLLTGSPSGLASLTEKLVIHLADLIRNDKDLCSAIYEDSGESDDDDEEDTL